MTLEKLLSAANARPAAAPVTTPMTVADPETAAARARALVNKLSAPSTEVEDRMCGLLSRMQQLQRRSNPS